jgi:hypothetical protein
VPSEAALSSSKRFVNESVSGSRIANSSSTATEKSSVVSKASRATRSSSSEFSACSSGMRRKVT